MLRVNRVIIHLFLSGLFLAMPFNTLAYGTDYRFTGKPLDSSTNLYYYGQRYYDPDIGRFTQPDPVLNNLNDPQKVIQQTNGDLQELLANPQRLNPYSYTLNNPINYIDPTGESEISAWLDNPYFTAQQISLWNNAIVNGHFRKQGKNISATFLQQSLKLRIGHNLDMNIKEGKDPNNVINSIKQSEEYKTFIQDKMQKAKESGEAFIHFKGGVGTKSDSLVFNSGDLQTSIGKVTNIYIDGKMRDNGTWELNVKIYDQYDFKLDFQYVNETNATGNNLAVLSQTQGAISNYNINIQFNDTW